MSLKANEPAGPSTERLFFPPTLRLSAEGKQSEASRNSLARFPPAIFRRHWWDAVGMLLSVCLTQAQAGCYLFSEPCGA